MDISKIFVVDDIFPDFMVSSFFDKVIDSSRWKYGAQGTGDSLYDRFFAIWIHKPHEKTNPFDNDIGSVCYYVHKAVMSRVVPEYLPGSTPTQIYRIHFNGQTPSPSPVSIHYDWDMPDFWTMLYYVGGVDGDTIFYDEPVDENGNDNTGKEVYRVKFKPGRLIIFPSYYWHAGEPPSAGLRVSLSINYKIGGGEIPNEVRRQRGLPEYHEPDLPSHRR